MKKNLLVGAVALLLAAGVTATVLNTNKKKTEREPAKKECTNKQSMASEKKSSCW